ncbi:MAG TPA: WYL domain-containing protein [Dehalococcoidia bacterium]|nr:WYL domain-containing protein [Dehalococcoidia bacterium]
MGWFIFVFICIAVFLFFILNKSSSRRKEKTPPHRTTAIIPPKRSSKEVEMHWLLDLAYTTKQRLTMKYETGNPLPGDPPVKIRDIDMYGLGDEYFEAYCHYRCEVRTFKISRVLWARLSGEAYGIPRTYTPSTWVTEGWGDLGDTILEPVELVPTDETHSSIPEDTEDKDERTKRERVSRGRVSYSGREGTRTYARYDRQKLFEESILTPFPEEWSPALPYLYEAHKLEKEGADPQKVKEALKKARQADSDATSYYIIRWSIIKKRHNQNYE